MSREPPPPVAITQTAKNVISEKQVLSHVLMIRRRHQVLLHKILEKKRRSRCNG